VPPGRSTPSVAARTPSTDEEPAPQPPLSDVQFQDLP
jgi:hypothetical protein